MGRALHERGVMWTDLVEGIPHDYYRMPISHCADIFDGKGVLEIGPGNYRHAEEIMSRALSYSVADISLGILHKAPDATSERHQIESYGDDFGRHFDTIVFWYVIHHVLLEEVGSFIQFLWRHLNPGGHLLFNMPDDLSGYDQHNVMNDGKQTSPHTVPVITDAFTDAGFTLLESNVTHIDSHVMLWRNSGSSQEASS